MFDQEKQQTGAEVNRMLDRIAERVNAGKVEKSDAEQTIGKVVEAVVKAKAELNQNFDFDKEPIEKFKKLSNAWTAWEATGISPDLKSLLSYEDSDTPASLKRYARQIWRTEMVDYLTEKLASAKRTDAATVMEQIMAAQIVTELENDPMEALTGAMWLDPAIRQKAFRAALAEKMQSSGLRGKLSDLPKLFEALKAKSIKVVTGGEFLEVPLELAADFQFKNIVLDDGRIYAQMENGCRGNLVIIETEKVTVPPPEPPKPPKPEPPKPPKPPKPEPEPEPEPRPLPRGAPTPELGEHIRIHDRKADLAPSAWQVNELIDNDVMTRRILTLHQDADEEAFMSAVDAIPLDRLDDVFANVFRKLNETDPARGKQLLIDILDGTKAQLYNDLLDGIRQEVAAATGDAKALWEIQLTILEGRQNGLDRNNLKEITGRFQNINSANLTPELKSMFDFQKRNFEYFLTSAVAHDIVATSVRLMDTTFDKHGDLKDLQQKSEADIKKGLRNEGMTEWTDTDAEVYLSSNHVFLALQIALEIQYPADVEAGQTIANPVQHYFELIKNGRLNTISVPAGSPPMHVVDALGKVISGTTINLDDIFLEKNHEFRLFEKYQNGDESLGSHSLYNWEGTSGAFLGEDIGKKGIVNGSNEFFLGDKFEHGNHLGSLEKLHIAKIQQLFHLKRYDEARTLCLEILDEKFAQTKPITPQDIQNKFNELAPKYLKKIKAQARTAFESQGLDSDAAVQATPNLIDRNGNPYAKLEDLINDAAEMKLQERAYIVLQGEVGEQIFKSNPNMNGYSLFERKVFEFMKEMNGYGNLDIKEEYADAFADWGIEAAEFFALFALTAGVGAAVRGAATAARITRGVTAAERARRITLLQNAAGTGARHFGRRGLEGARWMGSFHEKMFRAGVRVGGTRAGSIARVLYRPSNYLAKGNTFVSRRARDLVTATSLVEAQSAMHGQPINPLSVEGATSIGVTAATLGALNGVSGLLRGELASVKITAEHEAARAAGRALTFGQRLQWPQAQLGRLSRWVGQNTDSVALRGRAGYAGISTGEYAIENIILNNVDNAETALVVAAGGMTQAEADAMEEPDALLRYGHTAVVGALFRTWRHPKRRPKPIVKPPVEPPIVEPPPPVPPIVDPLPPIVEPPPPVEPLPPDPKKKPLPKPKFEADNVDWVASGSAKNAFEAGGVTKGDIKVGKGDFDAQVTPEVRRAMEEGIAKKERGEISEEALIRDVLMPAHRKIAERTTLLKKGGIVEYGPTHDAGVSPRAQAEAAQKAYSAEFPDRKFSVFKRGEKFYLREIRTHSVENAAKDIRAKHKDGVPDGSLPGAGGQEVKISDLLKRQYDGKSLKEHYDAAKGITDPAARETRLNELDHMLGKHATLAKGDAIEAASRAEAEALVETLGADYTAKSFKIEEHNGKWLVRQAFTGEIL